LTTFKNIKTHWFTPKGLLRASVLVAIITIAMKTLAWWVTDSVGLLSDAMESLVNLASAIFGLMMVTVASLPADEEHPYGHHKAEYFSSGFEGILIGVAALGIVWAAVARLFHPQEVTQLGWGLGLSVLSSALNGLLSVIMKNAASEHRSIALMADAKHLMADVWTSAGVVLGLLLVALTGWGWLDAVVALGVALVILKEGVKLLWESSQGLMDEALEPEVQAEIKAVLESFAHQSEHNEVIRFDHVATRRAGQRRYVNLHMHMPASWSLGRAATLRGNVESELMNAVPGLRATIELLPSHLESHFEEQYGKESKV
jgi:cation diffusion facilitator family transporter